MERLDTVRVVPVLTFDDSAQAGALGDALLAGGISCAEVTLRTPAGLPAIAALARQGDFIVGAGTVLTVADVELSAEAGASFLVSPGFDDAVVARAAELGLPIIPGVATATEIQRAINAGLGRVKLFPAPTVGGIDAIEAFAGPFPGVRFMPSGGVTLENLSGYLALPTVFAVSGSWMVPRDDLARGDMSRVENLSRTSVLRAAPR